MKNYLLFGDSNTWGYRPATDGERFPFDQRIAGVLQQRLGNSIRVIEEALNGRMTHWEDPLNPDKNGAEKSKHFPEAYKEIADRQGVHFLDASELTAPPANGDGVHIDETGAAAIGNGIADFIQAKIN